MLTTGSRNSTALEKAENPLTLFDEWFTAASQSELNDPNAMSLATATPEGIPSVRIVLMKRRDERGFSFFTNGDSRKGGELRANQHVALCFHWKSRQRQVRIEGNITELAPEEVDAYFRRRHRMSQIGAWASQQSRPLGSREELLALTAEFEKKFPDEVPRPPYWTGFVVKPLRMEFWQECEYRLHDRFTFTANEDGSWTKERLFP
jgi:pyridoxamine 5'-phosphate oxidase